MLCASPDMAKEAYCDDQRATVQLGKRTVCIVVFNQKNAKDTFVLLVCIIDEH